MKFEIDGIKALLDEQIQENEIYTQKAKEIKASDLNEAAKARALEALSNTRAERAEQRRSEAIAKANELKKQEKTSIDLNDQKLISAITLAETLKDKLPEAVKKDIIHTFTGNQAALSVIKSSFESNGIGTKALESVMYDIDETYRDLAESLYRAYKEPYALSEISEPYYILKAIEAANTPAEEKPKDIEFSPIPKLI